jgi:hypothetical protein
VNPCVSDNDGTGRQRTKLIAAASEKCIGLECPQAVSNHLSRAIFEHLGCLLCVPLCWYPSILGLKRLAKRRILLTYLYHVVIVVALHHQAGDTYATKSVTPITKFSGTPEVQAVVTDLYASANILSTMHEVRKEHAQY